MLHDNYLCLVESNKQQIKEVRNKIQAKSSETKATPKRVWICPKHSASAAFSWQENEEIKSIEVGKVFYLPFKRIPLSISMSVAVKVGA